jgi:Domain of unknown function (DUF1841).
MIFADYRRDQLRRMYLEAWRKFSARQPLEPLEAQIAAVIADHPEYIPWLESGEDVLHAEFTPEGGRENPFLHLGMHLAIREQVATDRPRGIAEIFRRLTAQHGSPLEAEHAMLEALGETLWEAQRAGLPPDEQAYLRRLERLPGARG